MSEQITYGIKTTEKWIENKQPNRRLYLHIPTSIGARIQMTDRNLSRELQALSTKSNPLVEMLPDAEGIAVFVNAKRIGNQRTGAQRQIAAARVVSCLQRINEEALPEEQDRKLWVSMSAVPYSDGKLRMHARLAWPKATDEETSAVVTNFMQDAAYKLKHHRTSISSSVGALVSSEQGVSINVDRLRGSGLDTIGPAYPADTTEMELHPFNIYHPVQQLISLVGVVALANADTLIAEINNSSSPV